MILFSGLPKEMGNTILPYLNVGNVLKLNMLNKHFRENKLADKLIYDTIINHNTLDNIEQLLIKEHKIVTGDKTIVIQCEYFSYNHHFDISTSLYAGTEKSYHRNIKKPFNLDNKEKILIAHWTERGDDKNGLIIITLDSEYEYCVYEFKGVLDTWKSYYNSKCDFILCKKRKCENIHKLKLKNKYQYKNYTLYGRLTHYDALQLLRQKIIEL